VTDTSEQEKESSKQKRNNEIRGYIFVGCVVTGMGISFATDTMPVGLFIGVGIGFLMMGLLRYKWSK
jgi:hypothetical protein